MAILSNCCLCISLRTGGIILGILSLIGACLTLLMNAVQLFLILSSDNAGTPVEHHLSNFGNFTGSSNITGLLFNETIAISTDDRNVVFVGSVFWISLIIGSSILMVVVSALLIHGSLKVSITRGERPRTILRWWLK